MKMSLIAIGLAAVAPLPARAQDKPATPPTSSFDLSGSVRLRYEALDGQFRPGFDARDDIFSIRTTILAEYRHGPLRVGAELYDSRSYGGEPGSAIGTGEVNAFEFVQAYVGADVADPFGARGKASLQAGRFTLNLGSRRLVAADDYRNTTNGYTGLRADWRGKDGSTATFIYTLPQIRLPDDQPAILDNRIHFDRESFDLRLWGGLAAKPKAFGRTMAELGYFRLQERDAPGRPTRDRQLHSISARLIADPAPGKFDWEAEAIGQFGTVSASTAANAAKLDVGAWFIHLDAGYSFASAWTPRVSIEFDFASGDGRGRRFGRFDTLFGMRRADLAPAGIYAALGRTNLSTPGIRIEASPTKRLDGFAVYRALWAASATDAFSTTGVRDASGASGRFAGHQLEGRLRYWLLDKRLRAEFNAAWLIKRGLLRDAPNAPATGDTHYASLALTATF